MLVRPKCSTDEICPKCGKSMSEHSFKEQLICLPKKIMNFTELVKSFIFTHGLITWHDKKSRLMDIDGITQKLGYFIIFETKTFYLDEIRIKLAPFCLLVELYNQLKRREIYIIGTESNDRIDPDDTIWWITLESVIKMDKMDHRNHVHIHRDQMHETTRKEFDFYANRELDVKGDPFYDAKEDALK